MYVHIAHDSRGRNIPWTFGGQATKFQHGGATSAAFFSVMILGLHPSLQPLPNVRENSHATY